MNSFSEQTFHLSPQNFFLPHFSLLYLKPGTLSSLSPKEKKPFLLPDPILCEEERFAEVAIGWNEEGIEASILVKKPFEEAYYPDIQNGDSVEIFLDTRSSKMSGYNTQFCHHFFFLPVEEGIRAKEITHFRTHDSHPLAPSDALESTTLFHSDSYTLNFKLPSDYLIGYDPSQVQKIGMTYRINRPKNPSQHFALSGDEYPFEERPALWAQGELIA